MTTPHDTPLPMPARVLVTGAAGFIGSHLVHRLVREGCAVVGFDRRDPVQPLPTGVALVRGDIRDADAIRRATVEAQAEVVFHLAAQVSVSVSMREPEEDISTNVLGTLAVLHAVQAAGARRLVFVSTGGALYGNQPGPPVSEQSAPTPESVYGASKLAAERYLALLRGDVEVSVVRPGNVYGPAQDPHGEAGVVAIFTERMLRNQPVTIFGDGSQQRDYVYVGDVVDALVRAATLQPATCLVGTGRGTSTAEIFAALARATGYTQSAQQAADRPGDVQRIVLDPSAAGRTWGWAPAISLDDGLAETVEWFRAHRTG